MYIVGHPLGRGKRLGFWVSVRSEAQELSGMVAGRRLVGGRLVSTVRGATGPRRLHKSTGVSGMRQRKGRRLCGVELTRCRAYVDHLSGFGLPIEIAVFCVGGWLRDRGLAISHANLGRAFGVIE